jgi:predicted nucleic acid-binding Zn ribbon protein
MEGRDRPASSAGKLVEELLREIPAPPGAAARERALLAWPQAAGETVASHSRAAGFAGKALLVETDDPGWAQELSLRRAELLSRMEELAGSGVVEEIRFVLKRG